MTTWKKESKNMYSQVKDAHNGSLPPGMYTAFYASHVGYWFFNRKEANSDNVFPLPGLPTDFILNQIENFWSKEQEYKKFGFLQKRGIMLYGPPGCGKSSIVGLLLAQLYAKNGICFVPNENGFSNLAGAIAEFRNIEPNRPLMTLVEDMETLLESSNGSNVAASEKAALSLYDGEGQFNNIVHVATTNKPEAVADRFIRRPGRFDIVIGIHPPSRETREAYLKVICNGHINSTQTKNILDRTEGLSLAYMREIASTYLVLGIPLEETIDRLRKQSKQKFMNKTGFTIGFTDEGKND